MAASEQPAQRERSTRARAPAGAAISVAAALLVAGAGSAAGALVPTPIGAGPTFHPAPSNGLVRRGLAVRRARRYASPSSTCRRPPRALRARPCRLVPAGIGMAPPLRTSRGYVVSGRCSYALRTREPTGVIEVARTTRATLGHFFAVWGRPLERNQLAGFHGLRPVRAYVDGVRVHGSPRSIVLRRHAEIVLELGVFIPPHSTYAFPKGL